jgi:hypothetical protein
MKKYLMVERMIDLKRGGRAWRWSAGRTDTLQEALDLLVLEGWRLAGVGSDFVVMEKMEKDAARPSVKDAARPSAKEQQ